MSEGEQTPTSGVPQTILERVSEERRIAGHSLKKVEKTGSTMHILDSQEKSGIVRNAEIPASSMAVWELLHTHVESLFPEEVASRLYGSWGRPQVAPILERKGENRVYYRDDKATAYSEMVGFDTVNLSRLLHVEETVSPYYSQNTFLGEPRWLACTSYHLAKDILNDMQSLDPEHETMNLIEEYWEEFSIRNQGNIGRVDLLQIKELRRQDMDRDDSYHSSLKLVETGHAITERLTKIYRELEQSKQTQKWKDKPVEDMILLLTHLYQTSAQQSEMWWLGVAHGHLHAFNTVSRIPSPDEKVAEISPLVTTIIDFDASRVSVDKLAKNDELYASIKGEELKTKIESKDLDPNLKLQLLFYLPLRYWDEDIIDFVQQSESPVKNELVRLVSLRAHKDVSSQERYTWFTDFVYGEEKKYKNKYFPSQQLTHLMLRKKPESIPTDKEEYRATIEYYVSGKLPPEDTQLSEEQKLLLLSAISYKKSTREGGVKLSQEEMKFAASQLGNEGLTGTHSEKLFEVMIRDYYNEYTKPLFVNISNGDHEAKEIAKKIIVHFFSKNSEDYNNELNQSYFMSTLVENGFVGVAIDLIDFNSLSRDKSIELYRNIASSISSLRELRTNPQEKNRLLAQLNKKAEIAFGKLFALRQKVTNTIKGNRR